MTAEAEVESVAVRRNRRSLQGLVVSDKMDKTVVVRVTRQVKHPRYKKYVRVSKKYMVHDEEGSCGIGDLVTIIENRPLSRKKRWRLRSIDRKAVG
jgi:small subunit ribosomal protein S17